MSIKVRFAPSPTGLLHIGSARTALINWLFAKKAKGHFMLRMDDTDLERSKESFAQAIHEDLKWLGLTYDSFYKQSERMSIYHNAVQRLIKTDRLYPCFETPEELDFKRKRQLAKGQPPLYDRASLYLTQAEKENFINQGRKPHWRFKILPEKIRWDDLIRGEVEFEGDRLSDPVLVKADESYLYTLTSVVDDLDLNITHILRGEDHVTNTAAQIQLFAALNDNKITDIQFGHTTLLTDEKGQGLSKRLGSLSLQSMREEGIHPMAINSLLAKLGTSQPVELCLEHKTLIKGFELKNFSRTPPKFNLQELKHLNQKMFQTMSYSEVKPYLDNFKAKKINETIWEIIKSNLEKLHDSEKWQEILFENELNPHIEEQDIHYIKQALDLLPDPQNKPWNEETWTEWTKNLKAASGRKGKDLFMPLRQALTGENHGPEMKDLLLVLGYDLVKHRLAKGLLK